MMLKSKEDFLKAYSAWKANKTDGSTGESATNQPQQSQNLVSESSICSEKNELLPQRYFRIPFTTDGQNKGLWFAHFNGPKVARQLEMYPGKSPVLLIAGRDDQRMCDLKLNETGLTRRKGAEIEEHDFEKQWNKSGGEPYITPVVDKRK